MIYKYVGRFPISLLQMACGAMVILPPGQELKKEKKIMYICSHVIEMMVRVNQKVGIWAHRN